MDRDDTDDPPKIATHAEVDAFERGRGPGPSLENFRVHLTGKGFKSKWNKTAAQIFAGDFMNIGVAPNVTEAKLKAMFTVHLVTLSNQYEKYMERGAEASQARLDKQALDAQIHRRRYVSNVVDCYRCWSSSFTATKPPGERS